MSSYENTIDTMIRLSYIVIISIVLTCVLAELYSDRFDDIDVQNVLQDDKLRDEYYNCFMNLGPCMTEDQQYLKDTIMEAFLTKCRRCTEVQKQMMVDVTSWFIKNKPQQWRTFLEKVNEEVKRKNANQ